MKRILLFSLMLILGLVVGASEVLLPTYYSSQVETGLRKQLNGVESLDVNISSHPGFLLLLGRVQQGSISAKEVQLQGNKVKDLLIQQVEAEYEDLVFVNNPEGAKAISGTNTFFQATFREADLNRYLNQRYTGFDQLDLDLTKDLATLGLQVTLFNTKISVKVAGNFQLIDSQAIRFVPQDLELENVKVPSILLDRVTEEIKFDLPLGEYPLPLDLREVRVAEGELQVLGGSELDARLAKVPDGR